MSAPASAVKDSLQSLWEGKKGYVMCKGVRFEMVGNTASNGKDRYQAIYVRAAAPGTKLYEASVSHTYLTLTQLRRPFFKSSLPEGSKRFTEQRQIWDILHSELVAHGIKAAPREKLKEEVSTSLDDLRAGVPGLYCIDEGDPKAMLRVRFIPPKKVHQAVKQIMCIELVSVDGGHPLCGYVRPGAYLLHYTLTYSSPNFRGEFAGDQQKLHEYLTDLITTADRRAKRSHLSVVDSGYRGTFHSGPALKY